MLRERFTFGAFLGLFVVGTLVSAPGALLPAWTADFGPDVHRAMGLFFNMVLLGLLVGVGLASLVSRRHPLIPISLGLLVIGLLLVANAPSFSRIQAAAILIGIGEGVLNVHGNGLVGDLHPKKRVAMLNLVNAAFGLGAVSTPLLIVFLPWRWAFLLMAALALAVAVLLWGAPETTPHPTDTSRIPPKSSLLFLLVILLYTGLEGSLATWSGVRIVAMGHSEALAATLLSLYWGALTVGRLGLGPLVARQPLKYLSILIAGSLAVLVLSVVPMLAGLYPMAGLFYGPLFGTLFALVQERYNASVVGSLIYAAAIGSTLVPAAFSLVPGPGLLPYGFVLIASILFAASWMLRRAHA